MGSSHACAVVPCSDCGVYMCSSKCSCPKTGISEDQYLALLHDDSEFFHGWFFALLEHVNAHSVRSNLYCAEVINVGVS